MLIVMLKDTFISIYGDQYINNVCIVDIEAFKNGVVKVSLESLFKI